MKVVGPAVVVVEILVGKVVVTEGVGLGVVVSSEVVVV